jgi:hypothetical protein
LNEHLNGVSEKKKEAVVPRYKRLPEFCVFVELLRKLSKSKSPLKTAGFLFINFVLRTVVQAKKLPVE